MLAALVLLPLTDLRAQSERVGRPEPVDREIIDRIRAEGLTRSRIPADIRYLVDVIGPRLTGSPAMDTASAWVARKMQAYGLSAVHLEPWHFGRGWEEVSYFGRMTGPFVKPVVGRSVAWSGRTDGAESGRAVFLGDHTITGADAIADRIDGGWVLLDSAEADRPYYGRGRPVRWTDEEVLRREVEVGPSPSVMQGLAEANRKEFGFILRLAELGARGIIRRSGFPKGGLGAVETILEEVVPPEVLEPGGVVPPPQVVLSDPDYALIYRNVRSGIPVTLEFDLATRFVENDPLAYNTIGDIPGSDLADEVVHIGAHLDSWHSGTGAVDDAAGSIVALEAMRIIATLGIVPRRTIRIGLWSGEEPEDIERGGRQGSAAYVEAHLDELDRTSVYLNLDQGTGRIRGIWEQGNTAAASVIAKILEPLSDLGVVGMKPGFFVGSDERNFAVAGVPSFPFVHDPMGAPVFHTDFDTFDALSMDDLKQAAVVVAVVAYHLAMRPEMLPR